MRDHPLHSRRLTANPLYFFAHLICRVGMKTGVNSLTYNPLLFAHFHRLAKHDAPMVTSALAAVLPSFRTVADVGSGSGAYAAELQRRGFDVQACEHGRVGRLFARRQGIRCLPFDLNRAEPTTFGRTFDLVYCFEVAEHVPASLGNRLVHYLASLAPMIVFTAAQPNQGGHGHINEQPKEYWVRQFEEAGAMYDDTLTQSLRLTLMQSGMVSWWLAGNCMVFRNGTDLLCSDRRS